MSVTILPQGYNFCFQSCWNMTNSFEREKTNELRDCVQNCMANQCPAVTWWWNAHILTLVVGISFTCIAVNYFIKSKRSSTESGQPHFNLEYLKKAHQEFSKALGYAVTAICFYIIAYKLNLQCYRNMDICSNF